MKKLKMDGIVPDEAKLYKDASMVNVNLAAMKLSDGIIKGCDTKNSILDNFLKKPGKPTLSFQPFEDEAAFVAACSDFYDELLEQEPVLTA
jgi:hypothetical protein